MNDPYQGGLTSYALVLMIVAFLQLKIFNRLSIDKEGSNLGLLYLEFLNYYYNMDYLSTEIKPIKPTLEVILPTFSRGSTEGIPNSIVIVDPLNPANNVARSTYNFQFLKV